MSREQTLLLGEAFPALDRYELRRQAGGRTACALSAGSSAPSPKVTDEGAANEDALLVIDEGARTLVAVADAHYGPEASHVLLERLALGADPLPPDPIALLELLRGLADPRESVGAPSESTLLIALLDRDAGSGFGASLGDSTLVAVGAERPPRFLSRKNARYVRPWVPDSLDPRRFLELEFRLEPGELLVAFSDGVDECHYESPRSSIGPRHLQELWLRAGDRPEGFVRDLTELALAGIDGNPGGQDNIAVAATR